MEVGRCDLSKCATKIDVLPSYMKYVRWVSRGFLGERKGSRESLENSSSSHHRVLLFFFLVACTRLYKPLCRSVCRSVCLSVCLSLKAWSMRLMAIGLVGDKSLQRSTRNNFLPILLVFMGKRYLCSEISSNFGEIS